MYHRRQSQTTLDRCTHRISCATDSNAHICALQGRGVIDAIASHAHCIAQLAQRLHNQELVVWEHLRRQACLLSHSEIWVLESGVRCMRRANVFALTQVRLKPKGCIGLLPKHELNQENRRQG